MLRSAKLSDGAFLILASVQQGWVYRSSTAHSDVWHISPGRGNGHKAIGRAPAGQKLVKDGLLTGGSEPTLTDEGRVALEKAKKEGRRLDYGVGRKPRVVTDQEQMA
ncbi:hypothetical protein JK364_23700 [Streptomyces sp. 110]|uniref:Uncharacterized protein n=1 Tax=Streptomyces endocoffeicus TaxID=2898945 RepID=A0ABS1PSW6_9ACTN|nr:hypothetical protein [Streptomyces endocoffeicus]MBL1115379.1 hypothetical protein [Streptomyces endocoffeicus]